MESWDLAEDEAPERAGASVWEFIAGLQIQYLLKKCASSLSICSAYMLQIKQILQRPLSNALCSKEIKLCSTASTSDDREVDWTKENSSAMCMRLIRTTPFANSRPNLMHQRQAVWLQVVQSIMRWMPCQPFIDLLTLSLINTESKLSNMNRNKTASQKLSIH